MSRTRSHVRSRVLRVAAWGAGALVLCVVAIIGASNVLLRTAWLRGEIGRQPEALVMDWKGARSVLPGRASVDVLTLRIRDSNMELEAVLEGVEVRFSIPDILRRRFHATRVRADRLTFRLRERMAKAEATPARLARYPRIEGWPEPPLLGVPAAPPPAEDPWRIVIDDLAVARVEEIWIDSCRWAGISRLAGSFEVLPGRKARVGPARLEVTSGAVRKGDTTVVARTAGSVRCEIPSFDTKVITGDDVWKIMTGEATLGGELEGLAFVSLNGGEPGLSGGEGAVKMKIALEDGVGKASLGLTARGVEVRTKQKTIKGTVVVDLAASGLDFKKGEVSLDGMRVVLSDVSAADSGKVRAWAATFKARKGRLDFGDGSVDLHLEGRIRDARPVVAMMPSGLPKWAAGILHLEDLEARGHLTATPSEITLEALRVSAGNFSLEGRYRQAGDIGHGSLHVKKGILSVRFDI